MPQIRKSYERFNVGAMMKAHRQAKEEAAIGHKSVEQLRKRVDAVAAKIGDLTTRWVILYFAVSDYEKI